MRHSIINKSPTLITFILFVILTQYIFINLYEVIANFIVSTLNDVKKITKFQKKKNTHHFYLQHKRYRNRFKKVTSQEKWNKKEMREISCLNSQNKSQIIII